MGNEADMKKCIIISAGVIDNYDYIKKFIAPDDDVYCADAGFIHAKHLGVTPKFVIGDFDSSDINECHFETKKLPVQKDETDTFVCLEECINIGYDDIILLGGTGGRLDHTYSNLLLLKYAKNRGANLKIIDEKNIVFLANETTFDVFCGKNQKMSLFAFDEDVEGLTIKNAKYPLTDEFLPFESSLCISNEPISDLPITVSFKNGTLMVIISHD